MLLLYALLKVFPTSLMDVDERTITSYVYSLVDDDVLVQKIEYVKSN